MYLLWELRQEFVDIRIRSDFILKGRALNKCHVIKRCLPVFCFRWDKPEIMKTDPFMVMCQFRLLCLFIYLYTH